MPTAWQSEQIAALEGKLGPLMASVKALAETDLPALNKLMNEAGVTHVTLPPVTAPRRTRRRRLSRVRVDLHARSNRARRRHERGCHNSTASSRLVSMKAGRDGPAVLIMRTNFEETHHHGTAG